MLSNSRRKITLPISTMTTTTTIVIMKIIMKIVFIILLSLIIHAKIYICVEKYKNINNNDGNQKRFGP